MRTDGFICRRGGTLEGGWLSDLAVTWFPTNPGVDLPPPTYAHCSPATDRIPRFRLSSLPPPRLYRRIGTLLLPSDVSIPPRFIISKASRSFHPSRSFVLSSNFLLSIPIVICNCEIDLSSFVVFLVGDPRFTMINVKYRFLFDSIIIIRRIWYIIWHSKKKFERIRFMTKVTSNWSPFSKFKVNFSYSSTRLEVIATLKYGRT